MRFLMQHAALTLVIISVARACDVCTDEPAPFMLPINRTCDNYQWLYTNRCNSYEPWRSTK